MNDQKDRLKNFFYRVIFGVDTALGRTFDIFLLVCILLSVLSVSLGSVQSLRELVDINWARIDWLFTIIFTIEYLLRIWCSKKPKEYIFSFWGKVDFAAIMPMYLSFFIPSANIFMILRTLRILRIIRFVRIFNILGLTKYLQELVTLREALFVSKEKIIVFLGGFITISLMCGTLMFFIEKGNPGFPNIPQSIYWAVVTMTTVGYGDIAPMTVLGKMLATIIMVMTYGIIAVPTGLVSAEIVKRASSKQLDRCYECYTRLMNDAKFCHKCGTVQDNSYENKS